MNFLIPWPPLGRQTDSAYPIQALKSNTFGATLAGPGNLLVGTPTQIAFPLGPLDFFITKNDFLPNHMFGDFFRFPLHPLGALSDVNRAFISHLWTLVTTLPIPFNNPYYFPLSPLVDIPGVYLHFCFETHRTFPNPQF